jgi:hypothetical protein
MDPDEELIQAVLLFDKEFHVLSGPQEAEGMERGLLICNLQRYD